MLGLLEAFVLILWFLVALGAARIVQLARRHADLRDLTQSVTIRTFSDETTHRDQPITVRNPATVIVSYLHAILLLVGFLLWLFLGWQQQLAILAVTSLLVGIFTYGWLTQYKVVDDRRRDERIRTSPYRVDTLTRPR